MCIYIYIMDFITWSLFLFWWLEWEKTNICVNGEWEIKIWEDSSSLKTEEANDSPFLSASMVSKLNRINKTTEVLNAKISFCDFWVFFLLSQQFTITNIVITGDNATITRLLCCKKRMWIQVSWRAYPSSFPLMIF